METHWYNIIHHGTGRLMLLRPVDRETAMRHLKRYRRRRPIINKSRVAKGFEPIDDSYAIVKVTNDNMLLMTWKEIR